MKTYFIAIFSLLGVFALFSGYPNNEPPTKEQAIRLAEQFIVDNGYTDLPANKSKLQYELFDSYESNIDSVISHRSHTLQPKAFCISENRDSWDIGFLATSVDLGKLDSWQRQANLPGRAVIVLKNGTEIRIAHKDPLFSHFEKL